ncbi:hypothetical protein Trco_003102 [Trichoderma cornu-damae]|uniref:Cerato-platanin n=1 Tax=Trichoderma cornu-damae TaxID=654480 RepID=A0A9P8TVP2_9HYPO|nr:hypothetical protein Trco_003102 [Trichoderma cornu-damae]
MMTHLHSLLSTPAALVFTLALPVLAASIPRSESGSSTTTVWATPHDSYSSSVGVLGCKVNTNRIAYWPDSVDCTNICVSLQYQDRRVHLLRVDQSQGAHDVSYDAWNYLVTGYSASEKPTAGGPMEMTTQNVDPSNCASLIYTAGSKLPLSAANSMNFLASCLEQENSWVGDNYVLYNILDSICTLGQDQTCTLDWPAANQPTCPGTLGLPDALRGDPVYNIEYPSGVKVLAGAPPTVQTAVPVPVPAPTPANSGGDENGARKLAHPDHLVWMPILSFLSIAFSSMLW